MSLIIEHNALFLALACIFAFFMAYGIGANDVANAMGTSVGSKSLTLKKALIIAAIFEFAGAYLAGGTVTETISKGLIDQQSMILQSQPELLVYGMLSALLATAIWLLIASNLGWPVSTTHSIIGAIVGFSAFNISPSIIYWEKLASVVASWIITPFIAGCLAYLVFQSIQKFILNTYEPLRMAKRYLPCYIFFLSLILCAITLESGLSYIDIKLSKYIIFVICIGFSLTLFLCACFIFNYTKVMYRPRGRPRYQHVERLFGFMMIFTACAMAFAHGSNDVANAVGPLATIVSILQSGLVKETVLLPQWVLILGGIGILIGLGTYGYKVIDTIGRNITELTPSRGFAAEVAAAITVIIASGLGLPISTTQTLVGAVLGIGMARGMAALNMKVIGTIFISWVVTLPAGALLSILIFKLLTIFFN
ncbi:MAG: inorganic phosphate transporter [Endozoicomonadaceae bacterium]|nr:inorganic phosphate transporter [Endozoicomonadaceae bacterium]